MILKNLLKEDCEENIHKRIVQKSIDFYDMKVCIEIVSGGIKYSTNSFTGEPWQKTYTCDYGYFDGFTGADGDFVDVYVDTHVDDPTCNIFVIAQLSPDGKKFDENKVMIGCKSADRAKELYLANCHNELCFGGIKEYKIDHFRELLHKNYF